MKSRVRRTYKNLHRLRQITNLLIKHGFGHFVARLNLQNYFTLSYRKIRLGKIAKKQKAGLTPPERIRRILEELGPTFIKFGQILSTRPDLLPPDLIQELRKLQDEVPPFSFEESQNVIKAELKAPLNALFSSFEEKPRAAASIAQIHCATLMTGQKVVVKVQRPNIQQTVETDIEILLDLAHLANRYLTKARLYNPVGLVEEFARSIRREIDFRIEANNTSRFRHNFADDEHVVIPQVYWKFSTQKVLTLENLEGIKISELEAIAAKGWDCRKLALVGARAFFRQIFEHGFFHADPHHGNIFVLGPEKIALIDFGIVGRLDKATLHSVANMLLAVTSWDIDRLVEEYLNLGIVRKQLNTRSFKNDLEDLLNRYYGFSLREMRAEWIFNDIITIANRYRISLPQDFVLLIKTLLIIGGLGRELDPDFNMFEVMEPYTSEMRKQRLQPKKIFKDAEKVISESAQLLSELPHELEQIIRKIRRGELKIEFEHMGLENSIRELDRASNRLSFSLVIAALIIGSSLIMLSGAGQMFLGFPILGIIGYLITGILGLGLAIAILRSGRL